MLRFLIGLQVNNRKLNRDIADFRKRIRNTASELLVPWTHEELELLSLNHHSKKIQKGFHRAVQGVFNSIYFEPMIAFAYKEYYNMSRTGILVAKTDDHEFIYKIKSNRIETFLEGKSYGVLKEDGSFIDVYRRNVGRIENSSFEYLSLFLGENHVANVLNPSKADDKQQRVVQLFHKLDQDQETAMLAMMIPELITRTFPKLGK